MITLLKTKCLGTYCPFKCSEIFFRMCPDIVYNFPFLSLQEFMFMNYYFKEKLFLSVMSNAITYNLLRDD